MIKILLAEDEFELSRAVTAVLTAQGFDVTPVYDGEAAVLEAKSNAFDCMVFDIMMPKKTGIEALKEIRSYGDITPVIMLTAKAAVDDRVEGLDAGADDYLTKPFSMKELLARIRSQTRRFNSFNSGKLTVGNITLNTEEQELTGASTIRLARKETQLLELLILNKDKALETEEIFNKVWFGEDYGNSSIVWVYISYLRQKLSAVKANLEIKGEREASYTLTER